MSATGLYAPLRDVLEAAYSQAAEGKGKERHANGLPFARQPILSIARMVGIGGPAQQVMKKTQEAVGLARRGEFVRAEAELLGAIVYAAAAIILLREDSAFSKAQSQGVVTPLPRFANESTAILRDDSWA